MPYLLVSGAVRHLGALETSLILLVEPVLNPLWALLLRRTPGPFAIAGGVVLLGATATKAVLDRR
ncbi:MAG: hypothetical protein U0168_06055 [Nannocystaceae bacterium]